MGALEKSSDGRKVSFAQNGEDIVLLRCFDGQESGFWIDVGANHPVNDSVTKNFSDLGWTGVNIEPVVSFHEALVADRPTEVNLLAAVSDETGELVFHQNQSNLDLSTFDDELAGRYRERGDEIVDLHVPIVRLEDVCAEHVGDRTIDFVKIDTEGHEASVIRSHDFGRYPVRVLLAEATPARLPEIVELLSDRGMKFVTFDALNAWFVEASEYDLLAPKLAIPPSPVLDWYHPAVYLRALEEQSRTIADLTAQVERLQGTPQPPIGLLDRARAVPARLRSRLGKR